MNILKPNAIIGTNSWGGAVYGLMLRGNCVGEEVIKDSVIKADGLGLNIYDFARDYGLGKAQKMIGKFGTENIIISAKYTPFSGYKKNCVRKSLEKDLEDFKRDYIDIYWLHLPTDIELHMREIVELYREGKIRYIGVSNFTLDECKKAKKILDKENIPLYGVQNHYSIISREWEKNGLLAWCQENEILFWAWAVLEEGMLTDPRVKTKKSLMKLIFEPQKRKMSGLYKVMIDIGRKHNISVPQVAIAFVANKGIVPICGCRKPKQVEELVNAVEVSLSDSEMKCLENAADEAGARIMGADIFRMFVRKEKK